MYAFSLSRVEEAFAAHLQGDALAPICVVSWEPLSEKAAAALLSSGERLGYGKASCVFVSIRAGGSELGDKEVFEVIEGIDPQCVVIADERAVAACAQAYRQLIEPMKRGRLFGREIRAFLSFESMLESTGEKQKAWALLKSLPRLR